MAKVSRSKGKPRRRTVVENTDGLNVPSVWQLSDKDVERQYRKLRRDAPLDDYTREDARLWVAEDWIKEHLDANQAVIEIAGFRVPMALDWRMEDLATGVARAIMPGFKELQEKRLRAEREE